MNIAARVAAVAFPASAIVILSAWGLRSATGAEVPEEVAAAATGLLTWASFILFGAGGKS